METVFFFKNFANEVILREGLKNELQFSNNGGGGVATLLPLKKGVDKLGLSCAKLRSCLNLSGFE